MLKRDYKLEQGDWETITTVLVRDGGSLIQDISRGSSEKQLDFGCIFKVESGLYMRYKRKR